MCRRRGIGIVPALSLRGLLIGSRIKSRKSHHRELRSPERRVETLVDRVAFPTPFRTLRSQKGVYRARQVGISLGSASRKGQGKHGVVRNKIRRLCIFI